MARQQYAHLPGCARLPRHFRPTSKRTSNVAEVVWRAGAGRNEKHAGVLFSLMPGLNRVHSVAVPKDHVAGPHLKRQQRSHGAAEQSAMARRLVRLSSRRWSVLSGTATHGRDGHHGVGQLLVPCLIDVLALSRHGAAKDPLGHVFGLKCVPGRAHEGARMRACTSNKRQGMGEATAAPCKKGRKRTWAVASLSMGTNCSVPLPDDVQERDGG